MNTSGLDLLRYDDPRAHESHLERIARIGRIANELEELLADEFREFGCSGREYARQDVIAAWDFGKPLEGEVIEYRVLAVGADVVLATYRTAQPGRRQARRSSIWCKRSGRWRLTFHQGTLAP